MRCVIFTHSVVCDWNHGNAHFLRGVAAEMQARGWDLRIFEPRVDELLEIIRDIGRTYVLEGPA